MNDNEKGLMDSIRDGNSKLRYLALREVYDKCFYSIESYVLRNRGAKEDAKDIFQDAMAIVYKNIVSGKFKEESSLKTYLFSISKNLWLQKLKKIHMSSSLSMDTVGNLPEHADSLEINLTALNELMTELKEDCQKLLLGFYYERKSMKDLMEIFKLGSEQAAKNKKLRCMDSLIRLVKGREMTIENFLI